MHPNSRFPIRGHFLSPKNCEVLLYAHWILSNLNFVRFLAWISSISLDLLVHFWHITWQCAKPCPSGLKRKNCSNCMKICPVPKGCLFHLLGIYMFIKIAMHLLCYKQAGEWAKCSNALKCLVMFGHSCIDRFNVICECPCCGLGKSIKLLRNFKCIWNKTNVKLFHDKR